ncbi:MAG: acetyltransferase [Anaerolinea sp.]|nr:acetyltransferase [Anaerolinea sp.]
MNLPIKDLDQLINSMEPVLNPGVFAFVSVENEEMLGSVKVIASILEPEGFSAVVDEKDAIALALPILFRAAWITLTINSDLQAVGLTAAFASALGNAGISCNVVAGAYHDHIFVPVDRAADAMSALKGLQSSTG